MDQFMTPRNMGLMGLAAGLLQSSGASPREITLGEAMGNGMQQGMQGIQQGMGLQMQQQHMEALKSRAEMARHKLEQEMAMKDLYRNTVQNAGTDDPVAVGRRLMNSGEMGLAKIGMDMMKSKQVKQFMKGMDGNGAPTYYAGYNTGELSPTGVTPAEKLSFQNMGDRTLGLDPYTGKPQTQYGQGITPGQQASLAQSERHFGASNDLAQQNAQLARAKFITETDPEFLAQKAAAVAGAKERAVNQTKAQIDLPSTVMQGENTVKLIDDLLAHPGFKISVGASAPIGYMQSKIPGTDASSFNIALEQLKGKQFLEAFESLKGGGAITQVEGEKATQAMSRMNTANTEGEFVKASREFQNIVKEGIGRAKNKAGIRQETPKTNDDGWGELR